MRVRMGMRMRVRTMDMVPAVAADFRDRLDCRAANTHIFIFERRSQCLERSRVRKFAKG